jgi:RimJ/RimL family protein N-acetyltransferase
MARLETDRLTLRMLAAEDFDPYAAMVADAEVMRFISPDGKPFSRFAAWQNFSAHIGHWQLRGFGQFALIERGSGEFVGRAGPWQPEGWPDFEIGWALRSQFWGRGYATEAANACLSFAFTNLGLSHVISLIDRDNLRSIRVAERIGERLEEEVTLIHQPHKRVLQYGLTRDEWAAFR